MSASVAKPHGLTDPERAAKILAAIPDHDLDTQRKMNYFLKPRGKRLSEYEILTVYSQPTPDWIAGGLDWGDWTQKFHGGRPSWGNELTELKSSDWHHHRDPGRRWHGPYVKDKSEDWRYTTRLLESFSADGGIRTLDTFWRDEILDKYYGALLYNEYALFNAHSSVLRDCLSDTIRLTAGFAALDKVDNAQMIQLQRSFIAKLVPGLDDSTHAPKQTWLTDPVYNGARSLVQEVWQGIQDFNEILWVVHNVYDPLFGNFARREFFQRIAPHFGDSLTPFFTAQAQTYFQVTRTAIGDLFFESLANDPQFGDFNRTYLRAWTGKWLDGTIAALKDFVGLYAKIPPIAGVTEKAAVTEAVSRVISDWVTDYADKIDYKVNQQNLVAAVISGLK
jgi:methane monooxygenase component A beta chain